MVPFRNREVAMTNITLKNIPAEVHRRLKQRAKRHRHSLNREAIECLREATTATRVEPEALLERVRQLRANVRGRLNAATLARLKSAGRP